MAIKMFNSEKHKKEWNQAFNEGFLKGKVDAEVSHKAFVDAEITIDGNTASHAIYNCGYERGRADTLSSDKVMTKERDGYNKGYQAAVLMRKELDGPVDDKEKVMYNKGFKDGYESIDVPLARKMLQQEFIKNLSYAYSYIALITRVLTEYDIKYTKTHRLSRDLFKQLYWGALKHEQKEGEEVIKKIEENTKSWLSRRKESLDSAIEKGWESKK